MPEGLPILLPAPPRAPGRPRRHALPGFASRLSILLDTLNWSRAELARRAGVDKSVALRWAAGSVIPGEASLVALTAAIRDVLPGFVRADWRLPEADFAARLRAGPAALPFPRAAAAAARLRGSWLLLHGLPDARHGLGPAACLAAIAPREGVPWIRLTGRLLGTWQAEGPVIATQRLLQVTLQDEAAGIAAGLLCGPARGTPMVLDGSATGAAAAQGAAVATRLVALRLDDNPSPPWRDAALRRLDRLDAAAIRAALPALPMAAPAPGSPASPLACTAEEIAAGLAPDGAALVVAARRMLGLA